jgi:hypothetical protein
MTFGDLLQKHGRPTDLKTALRQSVAGMDKRPPASSVKRGGGRKTAGDKAEDGTIFQGGGSGERSGHRPSGPSSKRRLELGPMPVGCR